MSLLYILVTNQHPHINLKALKDLHQLHKSYIFN